MTTKNLKVKIKKTHKDAVIPRYAKQGDAGMDLTATSLTFDTDGNTVYGTGLSFEIPKGYFGLVFPRSSISKTILNLTNCTGIIDSGFRSEVMLKFKSQIRVPQGLHYWWRRIICKSKKPLHIVVTNEYDDTAYKVGDRIGQIIIMPYPEVEFEEVDTLSETERGEGGFGSTGK